MAKKDIEKVGKYINSVFNKYGLNITEIGVSTDETLKNQKINLIKVIVTHNATENVEFHLGLYTEEGQAVTSEIAEAIITAIDEINTNVIFLAFGDTEKALKICQSNIKAYVYVFFENVLCTGFVKHPNSYQTTQMNYSGGANSEMDIIEYKNNTRGTNFAGQGYKSKKTKIFYCEINKKDGTVTENEVEL